MSVNALQHLIGVPLFAGLSSAAVASLAAHTRIQSFVDGDTIVEIDQSTPLFVVLEGRV
jgi:signal-transduction protein with cAMP-binding, CBS, and nucleotidyltransferase domain